MSMTGYGKARKQENGFDITIELKSVNARYLEYHAKIPRVLAFAEEPLKHIISQKISRGKVEFFVTIAQAQRALSHVVGDVSLAKSYYDATQQIAQALHLQETLSLSQLVRMPDVLTVVPSEQAQAQMQEVAQKALMEAVDAFLLMRRTEGERLKADLQSRLQQISQYIVEIEKNSEQRVEIYTQKLYQKLCALLEDSTIDQARILTEAAIFADKTAIDEETVRLKSHIAQFYEILEQEGAIGRKLDFLTQELNREINTIGSKCADISITRLVIEVKSEIEKIREQVQNIE